MAYDYLDSKNVEPIMPFVMGTINSVNKNNQNNRSFKDVYPRSEEYLRISNKLRAAGNYKRLAEISNEYNTNKKCTCNPAKRFKRAEDGLVLNSCSCGASK